MKKFKDAFKGVSDGLKHRAIMIQFVLALLAVIGGVIVSLDYYEWLAFIICIGVVIALEFVNTCIERLCDLYSTKHDERIRYIKDLSSGAVLIVSIMSLVVCLIVVIRRIG